LSVRVEHLQDLEVLAVMAIAKENPERLTSDLNRDHPQVGGLTPPGRRSTWQETRRPYRVMGAKVCFDNIYQFHCDRFPPLAETPGIVTDQAI
jgi:hypothetical protein